MEDTIKGRVTAHKTEQKRETQKKNRLGLHQSKGNSPTLRDITKDI